MSAVMFAGRLACGGFGGRSYADRLLWAHFAIMLVAMAAFFGSETDFSLLLTLSVSLAALSLTPRLTTRTRLTQALQPSFAVHVIAGLWRRIAITLRRYFAHANRLCGAPAHPIFATQTPKVKTLPCIFTFFVAPNRRLFTQNSRRNA
jgi:hypothetical protein